MSEQIYSFVYSLKVIFVQRNNINIVIVLINRANQAKRMLAKKKSAENQKNQKKAKTFSKKPTFQGKGRKKR